MEEAPENGKESSHSANTNRMKEFTVNLYSIIKYIIIIKMEPNFLDIYELKTFMAIL